MVADDVAEIGLLDGTLETDDVEEAVIALRQLRTLADRKQVIELHADKDGVLHLVLRVARVDIAPLDMNLGGSGIEILELHWKWLEKT